MTAEARPSFSAVVTARNAPRITIAVLMYHSGRIPSRIQSTNLGKKLPRTRPTRRAMMNPLSWVSCRDQLIPIFFISGFVVTAMLAQLPAIQQT